MIRIAVASGKGGTGKTTVAAALALSIETDASLFLDCDVEAPNAHFFLKPALEQRKEVGVLIPKIDEALCTHSACGRCAEVCQFNAIAVLPNKVLVFPELCHGCGSCTLICPEKAISEELDVLGILEGGTSPSGVTFGRGLMNVGEPMAVPIIRQLKSWEQYQIRDWETVIIDSPPGTSCPVVESVSGADFALLVTEPTPFGLHDLRVMVQVVQELKIPAGVVINRDGVGDRGVDQFCAEAGLPILMRIPLEREIGEGIARGRSLIEIRPEYEEQFRQLYARIAAIVQENGR